MNRHERRKAERGLPKRTVKSEIYQLTGKGGEPLALDIPRMRTWAEKHAAQGSIPIETRYIENLLSRGAVSEEHVKAVLASRNPKPLLVCRDINDDGDEIVDGNHTYVGLGLAWAMAAQDDVILDGMPPQAQAYILEPDEWRRFIIPRSRLNLR